MIQETLSRNGNPAITSDRWHVLHARWSGDSGKAARFERLIVSEHDDHSSAVNAAGILVVTLSSEMAKRPRAARDQVLVRPPTYKSLKSGKRVQRRRK